MPEVIQNETPVPFSETAALEQNTESPIAPKRKRTTLFLVLGIVGTLAVLGSAVFLLKDNLPFLSGVKPQRELLPISAAQEWRGYEDSEAGFSISYPETWMHKVLKPEPQKNQDEQTVPTKIVELSGKEGSITITYGKIAKEGSCNYLGGELEQFTVLQKSAWFCQLNIGSVAGRWTNRCGDCEMPERNGVTFQIDFLSAQDTATDRPVFSQILTTFTLQPQQ